MDATGFSVLGFTASWVTVCTGLWVFFDRLESTTTESAKDALKALLGIAPIDPNKSERPANIAFTFIAVLDRIFGERLVSWRSLRRSTLISMSLATILFFALAWTDVRSQLHADAAGWYFAIPAVLVFALCLNSIPDWISLIETRWLMGWLEPTTGAAKTFWLLLADFALTALVFILSLTAVGTLFVGIQMRTFTDRQIEAGELDESRGRELVRTVTLYGPRISLYLLTQGTAFEPRMDEMLEDSYRVLSDGSVPTEKEADEILAALGEGAGAVMRPFFYSTFYSSALLVLYCAAVWIVRFFTALKPGFDTRHPFRLVGMVSNLVVTIAMLAYALPRLAA